MEANLENNFWLMRPRILLILLGILSLVLYLAMWHISYQFNWGEGYRDRPLLIYLARNVPHRQVQAPTPAL